MSVLNDFLSALYGASEDPVRLIAGETEQDVTTGEDIAAFVAEAGDEPIYLSPLTATGAAPFLYSFYDNVGAADEWVDHSLTPTAVLFKDGMMICAYALSEPEASDTALLELSARMDGDLNEPIPTPGSNGWELVHLDPDTYHGMKSFVDLFGDEAWSNPSTPDTAPWDDEPAADYGTLLDARIVSPINLDEAVYAQPMTISIGGGRDSTNWKPQTMPVAQFIALLAQHKEDPRKDGLAFVMAEIKGPARKKVAVSKCFGVGLDIDVGIPGARIDAALLKLGVAAVRYTTHSHAKTKTEFSKDRLVKWADKGGMRLDDPEAIKAFLASEEHWDLAIVETADYIGDEHTPEGLKAYITHAPMPKHRVVVPLAEAFDPTAVAPTHDEGMKKWADVCRGLAAALGDLPLDRSALDPSRLFYFPRHAKNRVHETTIFGGPLLDWKDLDLTGKPGSFEAALEQEINGGGATSGKSRTKTKEGRELARWSIKHAQGFQVVEVIRDYADDRIRSSSAHKIELECPFDEEHSNPGDPDDRACFAVSAGDGPSEIFTVKCQHESCCDYTNLDMLGKMLKDQWFDREVLDDANYNLLEVEDASPAAQKVIAEDNARAEYEVLLDALTPQSDDEQVEAALRAILVAKLPTITMTRVTDKLKKSLKMTQTTLQRMMRSVSATLTRERNKSGDFQDPKNRMIFTYQGEYNFDEAFDIGFKALSRANDKAGEPLFSCVQSQPVRLQRDPESHRITFEELTKSMLWSELNKRITFVRQTDQGDGARGSVPKEVSEHVFEQAYEHLPQSPEVVYTPHYTENASLVVSTGYHPKLNMIMADIGFQVPELPSDLDQTDVDWAVNWLKNEVLIDFPFLDYDLQGHERREPSEANAMAMLITPFMRRMITSCTPVFFISKPQPGTGGTFLGKVPMILFDGNETFPLRYSDNEEEMQKALLASIMNAGSHLFFDDMKQFNSRTLLQSITSKHIGGRLLGSTKTVERPNRFNWVATGNNPLIGNEMARRICWIRLNLKKADIQNRKYKHPDFDKWLLRERATTVYAILILIQNWINQGEVPWTERKQASFEDWSEKVGGVLHAAGVEGFLDNRQSAGHDMDEVAIRQFVREWLRKFGKDAVMPSALFEHALAMGLDIIEGNNDDQKKQRFPRRLHSMDGRVFTIEDVDYMIYTTFDEDNNLVYELTPQAAEAPAQEPIAA